MVGRLEGGSFNMLTIRPLPAQTLFAPQQLPNRRDTIQPRVRTTEAATSTRPVSRHRSAATSMGIAMRRPMRHGSFARGSLCPS